MDVVRDSAQEITHKDSHMIAGIVNHRKIPNITVMIIDV